MRLFHVGPTMAALLAASLVGLASPAAAGAATITVRQELCAPR